MPARIDKTPEDFIKRLSTVDSTTNCWNWAHLYKNRGHCATYYWAKVHKVNRPYQLAYIIYCGEYDRSLTVSHLCHNSRCVNPEHLAIESHSENMARIKHNPNNGRYIAPDDILKITEYYESTGYTLTRLSQELGKDRSFVKRALVLAGYTEFVRGNKLSPSQVEEIKNLRANGNKLLYIASLYAVDESTISYICSGKRRNK